jgi:hypothetical protein
MLKNFENQGSAGQKMPMSVQRNVFICIAIVYVFFNSIALPEGLLYTTLLAPILFIYLLDSVCVKYYIAFFSISSLLAVIHFYEGVAYVQDYIKSFIILQSTAIFVIYAYYHFPKHLLSTQSFKILATLNLVLLLLSLLLRYIPSLMNVMWYTVPISPGVPVVPRLKMFTYEASYYSFIIAPVFIYYLLGMIIKKNRMGILFFSLCLSLILSFSLGVIAALAIALLVVLVVDWSAFRKNVVIKRMFLLLFVMGTALVILVLLKSDLPLFQRITNIWTGKDTSARGRTYEAFDLAWNIAKMKSTLWGIGLGQLKHLGRDYIVQYYSYSNIPSVVRIPNAVAETINIYGAVGVVLRFAIILYLFIKTKVWNNYYRLYLFVFVIYR